MIEAVGGAVDQLMAALDALAAEIACTVRECEVSGAAEVDGLAGMPSWLRGHGHLSTAEAARVVRAGRALAQLPAMAAAFVSGQVTGEQAAAIGRVAEPEHLARAGHSTPSTDTNTAVSPRPRLAFSAPSQRRPRRSPRRQRGTSGSA